MGTMTGLRPICLVFLLLAIPGCPAKDGSNASDAGSAVTTSSGAPAAVNAPPAASSAAAAVAPAAASASAAASAVASAASSAKPKANVPTCKPGQALGTVALSPFRPVCGAKCKTDADCTGGADCMDVNALKADGSTTDGAYTKICIKDYSPL
jgi:hypothetical protein